MESNEGGGGNGEAGLLIVDHVTLFEIECSLLTFFIIIGALLVH